jgi:plasmid stabilization system protein ParE
VNRVPVVALAAVSEDVQAAYDYFEARWTGAGDRFLDRYFETTDRIALNPEIFPTKFDDYRRALVPKSHMAVYYFVEPNRAVITAVIDARRHPRLIRDMVRERR